MEGLLAQLIEECRPFARQGAVASYIPALAQADQEALGIYVLDCNGLHSQAGDSGKRFTVQSAIKPLLLLQAMLRLLLAPRSMLMKRAWLMLTLSAPASAALSPLMM